MRLKLTAASSSVYRGSYAFQTPNEDDDSVQASNREAEKSEMMRSRDRPGTEIR